MDETENIEDEECYELQSIIEEEKSLMNLKRRWLIGLPLSEEEKQLIDESLSDDKIMPESLLREDDVSYEDIKKGVEMGFGLHKHEKEHLGVQEPVFKSPDDCKYIFSLLDAMTAKGLYSLCMKLTGGKVEFDKTKYIMKKTIKSQLRKVIADETDTSLLEQLSQVVNDPNNYLESQLAATTSHEAYSDTANKVLDELDDLCPITLDAMRRKLLGKEIIPSTWRTRQNRDYLISSIREHCKEMITELSKGGELAEKLVSALGIASLALKHLLKRQVAVNFRNFSPEVEDLQEYIAKSYWLLKESRTVSVIELRRIEVLLDPTPKSNSDSNSDDSRIRTRLCNVLTGYLFVCGDMDDVPDSLLEALDIINDKTLPRSNTESVRLSPQDVKDQMLAEVECVSRLSAQLKQVLLDSLQNHKFDEDFDRAFVENYEESDSDDDDWMIGSSSMHHCHNSHNDETESIGETSPPSTSLDSQNAGSMLNSNLKKGQTGEVQVEQTNIDNLQSGFSNAYLEMQEACDATSMVAYGFVGQKLLSLAGTELNQGNRLYLQSGASVPESSEEALESLLTSKLTVNLQSGASAPESSEEPLEPLLTSKLTGMWKDLLEG